MTRTLLALLACGALHAYTPTQTDLQTALGKAAQVWGTPTEVRVIRLERMNDCRGKNDISAWTEFATRSITVNSACKWTRARLRSAIEHEYGHMLAGTPAHSPDKRSVMYWRLRRGMRVTRVDREDAEAARVERETRPSILRGHEGEAVQGAVGAVR